MAANYKFLLVLVFIVVSAMCIDSLTGQQSNSAPTSTPTETASSKNPAFTIEAVWNESTAIKFTLRVVRTFKYDTITAEEFAKTKVYIDGAETACIPDSAAALSVYDLRVMTCSPNSYGTCVGGVCPTITIKVVSSDSAFDSTTYQYE